jgi:hypothetical protein
VPVVAPIEPPMGPPVIRRYRHYRPIAANG